MNPQPHTELPETAAVPAPRGAPSPERGGGPVTDTAGGWIARPGQDHATDATGAVLRAWRKRHRHTQGHVAELLGTTQHHRSQLEKGTRTLSREQRRHLVAELGIAPEELGLSSGQIRGLVAGDDASPEIATSRAQWRAERRWLNQHRSELARLAVDLYPAEQRIPRAPLIAAPEWLPLEPVPLRSIALSPDETGPLCSVDGSEPESVRTRPLRVADAPFEHYTSAVKHLDRPTLFESHPSYRRSWAGPRPTGTSRSGSPPTSTSSTSPRPSATRSPPSVWPIRPRWRPRGARCAAGSRSAS